MPLLETEATAPAARGLGEHWIAVSRGLWPVAVALIGAVVVWRPALLAKRIGRSPAVSADVFVPAANAVATAVGLTLLAVGVGALAASRIRVGDTRHALVFAATLCAAYVALTLPFLSWEVDDAGITFAFSHNLALGNGLRLHPAHHPEEGYSNTLWMLILAACDRLGWSPPSAAKVLGTVIGAAEPILAAWILLRSAKQRVAPATWWLLSGLLLGAPFVIWSVSGLEHGLHALLMTLVVACTVGPHPRYRSMGLLLVLLVLIRPETPLLVVAMALVLGWHAKRTGEWPPFLARAAWVVVPPVLALGALTAFRLWYFGAPLPNPYYAKTTQATPLRWFNPVGSGWDYVFDWMSASATFAIVPFLLFVPGRNTPLPILTTGALLGAHLSFVIYAGGDWMSTFRFMAAAIPLVAVLAAYGANEMESAVRRPERVHAAAATVVAMLSVCTLHQLVAFRTKPTTPFAIVTEVGRRFANLARSLSMAHPRLAHHDAGGTSYPTGLDVVDLGGLGNRAIAKHLGDAAFVSAYLRDARPNFVFGASNVFAARTGFYRTEDFRAEYVPLEFPGCPVMKADLSYIRRADVHPARNLVLVGAADRLERVTVVGCPD